MSMATSGIVDLYIYDKLKEVCKASLDSVIEVKSVSQFNNMSDVINMSPFIADRWLVIIDYKSVASVLEKKKGVLNVPTACFLIRVKNYKEFKKVKEMLPNVNDLYLTLIRSNEVSYLLKPFNGISESLIDFVAKSYSREPEKVFELRKELQMGLEVKDRRSIIKLLGASSGSINYFALQLLKEHPTTERGIKTIYRNRVRSAYDLCQAYGISTFRNYLLTAIRDIIAIKEMFLSGEIYNKINNVPDCFDEKRLSKYNFYLDTIKEIPYSRMMNLLVSLKKCGVWRTQIDMIQFLYYYYGGVNQ